MSYRVKLGNVIYKLNRYSIFCMLLGIPLVPFLTWFPNQVILLFKRGMAVQQLLKLPLPALNRNPKWQPYGHLTRHAPSPWCIGAALVGRTQGIPSLATSERYHWGSGHEHHSVHMCSIQWDWTQRNTREYWSPSSRRQVGCWMKMTSERLWWYRA